MRHLIPDDVTAEEAAAAIAAIEMLLAAEGVTEAPRPAGRWTRAARLEAQGLPVRGNEMTGWRIHSYV